MQKHLILVKKISYRNWKKTNDYSKIKGQFMGILKFKPIAWKKFDLVNKRYFKKIKKFTQQISLTVW